MSAESELSKFAADDHRLLQDLKAHIVQLESLVIYLMIAILSTYIVGAIVSPRYRFISWLVPCLFLAGTRSVVRVTNPSSSLRSRLTWGATLAGVGGTLGGAVGLLVDIGTLGISGGLGTVIGVSVGASAGAALGNKIEGSDELIEKGDAFDFLYAKRKKRPWVSSPQMVEQALKQIPSYDKNDDGRRWYAKADLKQFLQKGSSGQPTPPPIAAASAS